MEKAGHDAVATNGTHIASSTPSTRTALILYGSETGNAEDLAHEIANLTTRLRFNTTVLDLGSITLRDLLKPTLIIFTLSTTGQGEFPQNARRFWKTLLSGALKPGSLRKLRFCSFGLGDSSYARYNVAHRMLYGRLVQLGAKVVGERGEGNEQHPEGHSGGFRDWIVKLKGSLLEAYPLGEGVEVVGDEVFLEPDWKLVIDEHMGYTNVISIEECRVLMPATTKGPVHDNDEDYDNPPDSASIPIKDAHNATITSNQRATSSTHFQDVRVLDLHLHEAHHYLPGAVAVLYPKNFPSDVQAVIDLMAWQDLADTPLTLSPSISNIQPSPLRHLDLTDSLTLRWLLTNVLDIMSVPRRSFFSTLLHFLDRENPDSEYQRERLLELANPELIDELWDYTTRPKRTILEVLSDFTCVRIPFTYALTALPMIKGRQFSIATGGEFRRPAADAEGTRVQLLVAIADPPSPIIKFRRRYGVCTRWVKILKPGQTLRIGMEEGYLDPRPEDITRPVMMVAPGTGVAPMRSLVWQRVQWWEEARERGEAVGEKALEGSLLLTGSRAPAADWHFASEYPVLSEQHGLTVLPAFSRSKEHKRQYVQDVIRENAEKVRELLLHRAGTVYVCGSSGAMPKAVREAVIAVIGQGDMGLEAAESWVEALEKAGGWKQETW